MYIHFTPGSVCAGFYSFQHDNFSVMRLVECCQVPSGQLNVVGLGSIPIDLVCEYKVSELSCDPKVAHDNYLQDCFVFERHSVLYDEYIYKINDHLIDNVNDYQQADQECQPVSALLSNSDPSVKDRDIYSIPNGLGGHLYGNYLESDLSVSHDFDIVDKTRSFLNQSSGKFSFIGPDRDLVTIFTIPQCFDIGKNYQRYWASQL